MISPLLNISGSRKKALQFNNFDSNLEDSGAPIVIIRLEIGGLSTIIGHVQVGQTMAICSFLIVSADEKVEFGKRIDKA